MFDHKSESIYLPRILTGNPDRVFDAWTNPFLLQQWLAPKAQVDAREGGHFRLEAPKPEGVHVVTGIYQEFKQNERLVMTWVYDGPTARKHGGAVKSRTSEAWFKHRTHVAPRRTHEPGLPRSTCKRCLDNSLRSTGQALAKSSRETA